MTQSNNNAEHYSNPHCEESLKKWRERAAIPDPDCERLKRWAGYFYSPPGEPNALREYLEWKAEK